MNNPLDHQMDLGLVNYVHHPENENYIVYRFSDFNRSKAFEVELIKFNIWFEKAFEESKTQKMILFCVQKKDFIQTQKLNFLIESRNKKRMIPSKRLRFGLFFFTSLIIIFAVFGYCQNNKKDTSLNKSESSVNLSPGKK